MKKLLILFVTLTFVFGCAPATTKSQKGARKGTAIGALAGAGLGAVIGGDAKGALIGMGIGALVGGFAGKKIGQNMDEQEAAIRKQLAEVEAANIQRNAEVLAITFRSDFLFDVDSAALKPGADAEIQRVSTVLTQYPQSRIRVAGHTDSSGSVAHNQQLSERRAMSVKNVFVNQGVHPARIQTIGFGAQTPIANNSTPEGRQLNRRVVVTIRPEES